jgi:hypothetical protein
MQCPAIGSCLIEEFCGTYYQQGVPPCASKLVEAAPSASANSASDAIALLREIVDRYGVDESSCWLGGFVKRAAAIVQQRTLP